MHYFKVDHNKKAYRSYHISYHSYFIFLFIIVMTNHHQTDYLSGIGEKNISDGRKRILEAKFQSGIDSILANYT